MAQRQGRQKNELFPAQPGQGLEAREAADRAGELITEQVRSIMQAADASAAEMQQNAEGEADAIRERASDAALRVLQRIDAIESELEGLVDSLRRESTKLSGDLNRRRKR